VQVLPQTKLESEKTHREKKGKDNPDPHQNCFVDTIANPGKRRRNRTERSVGPRRGGERIIEIK